MVGWKSKIDNSSTTEFELWRNAGPIAFHLQKTMLKSDKIRCTYLVNNCVNLRTFWMPLVHCVSMSIVFFVLFFSAAVWQATFWCVLCTVAASVRNCMCYYYFHYDYLMQDRLRVTSALCQRHNWRVYATNYQQCLRLCPKSPRRHQLIAALRVDLVHKRGNYCRRMYLPVEQKADTWWSVADENNQYDRCQFAVVSQVHCG